MKNQCEIHYYSNSINSFFCFFFFFNRIGKSRISVRVLGIVVLRTTLESPVLDFSGESKCLFGIVFRRNSKSDLQVCGFN